MANPRYACDAGRVNTCCCTPTQALQWLEAVSELALAGDPDAVRWLPRAVEHYLAALR